MYGLEKKLRVGDILFKDFTVSSAEVYMDLIQD